MMKRALIACAAGALLVAPGASAKPSETDKTNAAKECRAEREADATGFAEKYGTNENGKNAFGKCVSSTSKEEEAEGEAAAKNAAKDCKAEREAEATLFAEKYGTNQNGRNAYGKCVSSKAKENQGRGRREGRRGG